MGKKAAIAISTLIVLGIAVIAMWGREYPVVILAFMVCVVLWISLRSIDSTLKSHPELALLDGTEIVAIRKMELAAKNTPIIRSAPMIEDPAPPALTSEERSLESGE